MTPVPVHLTFFAATAGTLLVMLGLYTLAIKAGAPAVATGVGFGVLFALAIAVLWLWRPAKR